MTMVFQSAFHRSDSLGAPDFSALNCFMTALLTLAVIDQICSQWICKGNY